MRNSWDIPLRPEVGDRTAEPLFEAVGRALTDWETLEECWAGVFAYFAASYDEFSHESPAVRAYGSIMGFTSRKGMLEASAAAYFARRPDAEGEATFHHYLKLTSNFSARRNEIAHGRVGWWLQSGYFLFPSSYNTKKNPLRSPPAYAYSSLIINGLREQFREIAKNVDRWCWDQRQAAPASY